MKVLLLMRHAKSSWKYPELTDHDRPLSKRGTRDAPRMGRLLEEEDLTPDVILSSPALRARDTAIIVAKYCHYKGQTLFNPSLYVADSEEYLKALQNLPDHFQRALIVGHNPGIAELVRSLTMQVEEMPTAAIAHVRLPIKRWSSLDNKTKGELVATWRPKELDTDRI